MTEQYTGKTKQLSKKFLICIQDMSVRNPNELTSEMSLRHSYKTTKTSQFLLSDSTCNTQKHVLSQHTPDSVIYGT